MPPRGCELVLAADRQLLERFEAVGGEAGSEDGNAPPLAAQPFERRVGRGFEPLGAAEARLERHLDRAAERVGEQRRGLAALVMIGVAEGAGALGHAVEAGEQHVGHEVERGEAGFDRGFQRPDIKRIGGKGGRKRRLGCQRRPARCRFTASVTVAVVAAQYCG